MAGWPPNETDSDPEIAAFAGERRLSKRYFSWPPIPEERHIDRHNMQHNRTDLQVYAGDSSKQSKHLSTCCNILPLTPQKCIHSCGVGGAQAHHRSVGCQ